MNQQNFVHNIEYQQKMSKAKPQRLTPPAKETNQGTQVMWRKVTSNPKIQQATTVSSHVKKQSQNIKSQSNLNIFLQRLHDRMPESMNHSQSQIMERESIDWSEDLGKPVLSRLSFTTIVQDEKISCSERALKCVCLSEVLAQIRSIEEFLLFIENVNTTLYSLVSAIVDKNINLELQCEKLKNSYSNSQTDNQLLRHQVQILQQNNIKQSQELNTLKKQISVLMESNKIKSKSIKSNNTAPQQNDKKTIEINQIVVNQCGEYKRCGKLTRSRGHNHRGFNNSTGPKSVNKIQQQQKNRYIGVFNKVNQSYDKIIHQVLQQDRKQLRSIKLFTNI